MASLVWSALNRIITGITLIREKRGTGKAEKRVSLNPALSLNTTNLLSEGREEHLGTACFGGWGPSPGTFLHPLSHFNHGPKQTMLRCLPHAQEGTSLLRMLRSI